MLEKYIKSFMSLCKTEPPKNIIRLIEQEKVPVMMNEQTKDALMLKTVIGKTSMYKIFDKMNGGSIKGIKLILSNAIKNK